MRRGAASLLSRNLCWKGILKGGGDGGWTRRCLKKRSRLSAYAEIEVPEERPLKRLRQKSKNQWRFGLPHSSDLDGDEHVLAPLARSNTQKTETGIEHPAPCENLAQSIPFGNGICLVNGICPVKSNCGRTEFRKTPMGDGALCVPPGNRKIKVQANPCNPSTADVKRDDGSEDTVSGVRWCGHKKASQLRLDLLQRSLFC
ncbi:unnamed protein product [Linum trigynum]|uniref:Uncharacterized protein n=1 Tax=Linum trigynum TaxID=586398 RepID=A0AAV2CTT8_9ROSI